MSWGDPVRNGLSVGIGTLASLTSSAGIGGIRRPTMSLNFLLMSATSLDSRITFSRGTNATLTDSTGRITYAPANLLLRSQEFDNASWAKTNAGASLAPVVTANAGTAPDGTLTADRVQLSLNGGTTPADNTQVRQTISTDSAVTYAFSFWARATDGVSSYNMIVFGAPAAAQPITVTGAWTRFSVVGAGANQNFAFAIRGGQTPTNSNTADILVWGAQLEPVTYQTTPSTYVATTSAAYYGPRFDYDPVTLAARGLLIEEARTNLLLRSEEFDNASWNKTRSSVSANATASPSGVVNADKLVENTDASTTHGINQVFTGTAASHTFTVYAKASERSQIRMRLYDGTTFVNETYFNLATGAVGAGTGGTITNAGNGWYRCSVTGTLAASAGCQAQIFLAVSGSDSYTGDGTSGLFLWGAQLEAGAFATSYTPTVASTVTRNADVATMTGANFSSWFNANEGALAIEMSLNALSTATSQTAAAILTDNNNIIVVRANNTTGSRSATVSTAGVGQGFMDIAGTAANAVQKLGYAYRTNDTAFVVNGGTASTDNTVTLPAVNQLNIGSQSSGAFTNGHIRTIAYYNTRLPNSQLQTLTAPSLSTTLSLDFINGAYNVGF